VGLALGGQARGDQYPARRLDQDVGPLVRAEAGAPAAAVELDVKQGKVSTEAAERDYGLVVGDAEATATKRARIRAERPDPEMFDRGPGYTALAEDRAART
jgi:hypothetical protein